MLENYSNEVVDRAKKIKLLLLDVDGVMSDGRLIYTNYGDEMKNFDVNDGLGIFLVKRAGLKCVILTAMASHIVKRRAKELRIDKVYHNFHYKIKALDKIKQSFKVDADQICFVGDDLIDIPVLRRVGLAVCPPNAMRGIREVVHLVTQNNGGRGAVREVCELILHAQGLWNKATSKYFE